MDTPMKLTMYLTHNTVKVNSEKIIFTQSVVLLMTTKYI